MKVDVTRIGTLLPMPALVSVVLIQQYSISKYQDMVLDLVHSERQVLPNVSVTSNGRHVTSGGDAPVPSTLAAKVSTSAPASPRGEPPQQLASLESGDGNSNSVGRNNGVGSNNGGIGGVGNANLVEPSGPHMEFTYLADYAYSETPPDKSPAKIVLASLEGVPEGTPMQEIKHASDAFGIDYNFMRSVAKIESDFDPKNRTGKYIGLFQLSDYEFNKYGTGTITDARDNAIAAAYKFATAAKLFEIETHKEATPEYLYLIHQQGEQGAAQHVSHPERVAWESMCATDEGRQKGEGWCKKAIWGNTLPTVKKTAGSVEKLLSGDFVQMWSERVKHFLAMFIGKPDDVPTLQHVAKKAPEKKHDEKKVAHHTKHESKHASKHEHSHSHKHAKA